MKEDILPKTVGNPRFSEKFSVKPSMLPHETHLMREIDGVLYKMNDVQILLNAEKFAKMYGPNYVNSFSENLSRSSPLQKALDNLSDDAHLSVVGSKYVQRSSEIKNVVDANINAGKNISTKLVDNARKNIESKQQESTE